MEAALISARRQIGLCAKTLAAKAPAPMSVAHAEQQIGLGTCGDWIAWAAALRKLDFRSAIKRKSPRANNYLEATRFTYTWTAANAIFSRSRLLAHFTSSPIPKPELARFRLLYSAAALTPADVSTLITPLHTTLLLSRAPDEFPWANISSVRIIDLIFHKYMPDDYKAYGASRAVEKVVNGAASVTSLDLPVLLYSTRNWLVHGALVDSSFRGAPRDFSRYMTSATKALAIVIGRAVAHLTTVI